ncbi:hypothetical protein BX616_003798 [Lobosporangium transversale]|nr:hypothetical protein BX616_003798 [Lobosporangium transversale]
MKRLIVLTTLSTFFWVAFLTDLSFGSSVPDRVLKDAVVPAPSNFNKNETVLVAVGNELLNPPAIIFWYISEQRPKIMLRVAPQEFYLEGEEGIPCQQSFHTFAGKIHCQASIYGDEYCWRYDSWPEDRNYRFFLSHKDTHYRFGGCQLTIDKESSLCLEMVCSTREFPPLN